MRGVWRNRDM
uniref:Uncharacterized protein n=1 Tax=Anguilla anguilla TaxID=7936 RepID=A0A0E9Q079_ANGAN